MSPPTRTGPVCAGAGGAESVVVGAVLNRVNFDRNKYYYSRYYGYQYKSYYGQQARPTEQSASEG